MTPPAIDQNDPFTRNLLRSLTATLPAQRNESAAEFAERSAAASAALAALGPRDPVEQMLAAQVVAAHYAGLDCLNRAMAAESAIAADKLHRSYVAVNRAMTATMRLLDKQRQRPDEALAPPPPILEPIPALRPRPAEQKVTQDPIHREKAAPEPPAKDPSKMTDEELAAGNAEMRALYIAAMSDPNHPLHQEAMRIRPEDLPEGVLAECQAEIRAHITLGLNGGGDPEGNH